GEGGGSQAVDIAQPNAIMEQERISWLSAAGMKIDRAESVLSQSTFERIFGLTKKCPWLLGRQKELSSLSSECVSEDELLLVIDLLERFSYVDGPEVARRCAQIRDKIISDWSLSKEDTRIVCKSIEEMTDSSVAVNYFLQQSFGAVGWKKDNFSKYLSRSIENKNINNIVIVDDFSGTGNSLKELSLWIEKKQELLLNKKFFVCLFCAMEQTFLQDYNGVFSDIFSIEIQKKGISDYNEGDVVRNLFVMSGIEERIRTSKKYRLGYEGSEALYCTENFNIPNNNFPVFWQTRSGKGSTRSALFGRI
ncbi:hypothetical protein VF13_39420, partial [Nostoc linckia z16]